MSKRKIKTYVCENHKGFKIKRNSKIIPWFYTTYKVPFYEATTGINITNYKPKIRYLTSFCDEKMVELAKIVGNTKNIVRFSKRICPIIYKEGHKLSIKFYYNSDLNQLGYVFCNTQEECINRRFKDLCIWKEK